MTELGDELRRKGLVSQKQGSGNPRKCRICGNDLDPSKPQFDTCYQCSQKNRGNPPYRNQTSSPGRPRLLASYYDDKGNLLSDVYVDVPEQWANCFQGRDVKTAAIRRFYTQVRRIYDDQRRSGEEGFGEAVSRLCSLIPKVNYKTESSIVNEDFFEFINHHVNLARKSPENLKGFKEHFESVVCYLKKEQRGRER